MEELSMRKEKKVALGRGRDEKIVKDFLRSSSGTSEKSHASPASGILELVMISCIVSYHRLLTA
jgi:hypothetical protein